MAKIKVAVVGGGIAGLTAALRLQERGYEVTVFERATYLGGKLGAHRHRYLRVDLDPAETAEVRSSLENGIFPERFNDKLNRSVQKWHHPAIEELTGVKMPKLSPTAEHADRALPADEPQPEWSFEDSGAAAAYRDDKLANERPDRRRLIVTLGERSGTARRKSIGAYSAEPSHWLAVTDDVQHEHCYHMFLSWYHNFWRLMEDIHIERSRHFTPRDNLVHLFPGKAPIEKRSHKLREYGSFDSLADNLLSRVAPVPDVLLWLYSLADLTGQSFNPARYLDIVSVHGFMSSRWYGTALSAELHEHMLAKAFAVPSYFSSARSYRNFVEYSMRDPHPLLWVMNGNSNDRLFLRLGTRLEELGCEVHTGARVTKIAMNDRGHWTVGWERSDIHDPESPELTRRIVPEERAEWEGPVEVSEMPEFDYMILAVPPTALADLVEPFRAQVPGLTSVRKLRSGVTASLDLYFNKRIPDLPCDHVVLRGSKFGLTFIDNSQAWRNDANLQRPQAAGGGSKEPEHCTCLNVAATDYFSIDGMSKQEAMLAIVSELRRYVAFEYGDVDWGRTYIQMNQNDPLFLNEVGSELWQPDAVTDIPSLFLAGDFCDNPIGVVTVEAAVVTGLQAARAVQARVRLRGDTQIGDDLLRPIEILEPETYPEVNARALKLMLTPYALAAKAWSRAEDMARSPARALSPREISAMGADLAAVPGALAADYMNFAVEAMRWMADVAYRDDPPGD